MSHRPRSMARHGPAGHWPAASAAFSAGSWRECDRCGMRSGHFVKSAAAGPGECRGCRADHDPVGERACREHRWLGWWPKTLPADLFMREHGGRSDGVLRTVIPAAPDAWITALERHGTCGSPMSPRTQSRRRRVRGLSAVGDLIASHEHEYRRWNQYPDLPAERTGAEVWDKFVQTDLARTLQYMADQDRAAGADRKARLKAAHVRSTAGTSRARSCGSRAGGRLPVDGGSGRPRSRIDRWCGGDGAKAW